MPVQSRKANALDALGAALLGLVAFLLWAGPRLLDPTFDGWLKGGDRAMHTVGWWYFRNSPWGMPLGINPHNGLELSNSVALSDSLPLMALPFKLLAPLLPATFQYWGIWLLLSMILQAVFGWALARELRLSRLTSLIFAAFVILMPAFLFRLPLHMALASHWVLLAGLYLYARQVPPPRYLWPLLLAVTAAIHAYLLAMVAAIWLASLLQRGLISLGTAIEVLGAAVATAIVLWAAGFFMPSTLAAAGFGFYRLNLLSFLDPFGWSRLLPALPHTLYDYEGMVFLGLGGLLLSGMALVFAAPLLRRAFTDRWMPLLLVMIALVAFAVSDRPVIGELELGTIPLPAGLLQLAAVFRASGRMVWPPMYLLLLTVFVLLDRRFGARRLVVMASLALTVQVADMSAAWQAFARSIAPVQHDWSTPMQSPFWDLASRQYTKVRALPFRTFNPDWMDLARYASLHGMASDAVSLARMDAKGFLQLDSSARAAMRTGSFEPDALYLLDQPSAILAQRFVGPGDLLARIDGFYVFARGGAALAKEAGIDPNAPLPDLPLLPTGTPVNFATAAGASYLPPGDWQAPLPWGVPFWLTNATLGFHQPADGAYTLHLVLAGGPVLGPSLPAPLDLDVDGRLAATVMVPAAGTVTADLTIPARGIGGNAVIGLHFEDVPARPGVVGMMPDIGVVSMELTPLPPK